MLGSPIMNLLDRVSSDIDALPLAAVQMAGAVVSMHEGRPDWLFTLVMERLGRRTDMNLVSPAAEALMKVMAFSSQSEMAYAKSEIQTQWAFLQAIQMEVAAVVATQFLVRLKIHLIEAALELASNLSEVKSAA